MNEFLLNAGQLLLKGTEKNLNAGTIASVVITGIVVVFIGLILLIICVSIYGKIFDSINKSKAAKKKAELEAAAAKTAPVTVAPAPAAPVVEDGIEEEIVAVIAAAVAAMGASSGKKLALRSVKTAKPQRNAWASAGISDNTRPF